MKKFFALLLAVVMMMAMTAGALAEDVTLRVWVGDNQDEAWINGVIEAFTHESRPIVGVQWDPEHTTEGYERDDAVYRMFIDMVTGRAE